jgi:hypothetical protein
LRGGREYKSSLFFALQLNTCGVWLVLIWGLGIDQAILLNMFDGSRNFLGLQLIYKLLVLQLCVGHYGNLGTELVLKKI